ncbi:acyl carrier protein [Bacteroides caecimuris]|uniref:acyl carrier protein n=1 Tax=Bacteroides caecimuris TaxID=1796613 RepID=UPI00138F3F0C|nr:acyl carrier protein [Bacteroides caecimuris]NDO61941.1 acyl carrier protein [Bacteroides caecimuris]
MTLNEFIKKFAEEFDETPMSDFTADTRYRQLDEWSSLSGLSIISMIDEEFDKQITGADLRSVLTIEELYNLVKSK